MARNAGRPAKYQTDKQLRFWVDQYFKKCKDEDKRPKLTGLYKFLGVWPGYFQEVADDKKAGFSKIIRKATATIAEFYEDAIDDNTTKPALGIFMLKNCGYTDRVEVNANVSPDISLSDMARQARAAAAR